MWQDIIFTTGSLIFAIALLPSILGPDKPAVSSSVMTGSVLYVFSATYFSLGLVFAAFSVLSTAILWTILAVQKYRQI